MIEQLQNFAVFPVALQILPLLAAYLLAFPIGWDREQEDRSAGVRTFPLVALASCGFLQAAEISMHEHPEAMARVVEGLITGMGFIGGGAILQIRNQVHGTATAASLWATGAIGTAVALGSYDVAIVISIVTVLTLRYLMPIKKVAKKKGPKEGEIADS